MNTNILRAAALVLASVAHTQAETAECPFSFGPYGYINRTGLSKFHEVVNLRQGTSEEAGHTNCYAIHPQLGLYSSYRLGSITVRGELGYSGLGASYTPIEPMEEGDESQSKRKSKDEDSMPAEIAENNPWALGLNALSGAVFAEYAIDNLSLGAGISCSYTFKTTWSHPNSVDKNLEELQDDSAKRLLLGISPVVRYNLSGLQASLIGNLGVQALILPFKGQPKQSRRSLFSLNKNRTEAAAADDQRELGNPWSLGLGLSYNLRLLFS